MGNLNINFGSGKGTVYSNQNSENSLYSLLKGNQEKQKNSLFNSAGSGFSQGLFSGSKNSSIVNSINSRTSSLNSINTLKEQNPTLWAFLHPAEARAEGMAKSDEIKMLEESLKDNGLDYDYKKVSKAIKDSKDSGSASKAVSTARKTLSDLKQKIKAEASSNESTMDPYEAQAALVHAEKMLHIAEKHLKNVKEEEIAQRNQKGGEFIDLGLKDNLSISQGERESAKQDAAKAEESEDESIRNDVKAFMSSVGCSYDTDGNIISFKGKSISGISPQQYERALSQTVGPSSEIISGAGSSSAMLPDASSSSALSSGAAGSSDEISSLMNDLGISDEALPDFLDDITTPNLYGMELNEVKMLKLKHRLKENIAIAKADAEYLKVVFERMNSSGSGSTGSSVVAAGSNAGSSAASFSGGAAGFDAVSLPSGEVVSSAGSVPVDSSLMTGGGSPGLDVSI